MSMRQTAPFLVQGPLVPHRSLRGNAHVHCFVYSHHYNWVEFQREVEGSTVVGLGRIGNWVWHINSEKKPNIRRPFAEPRTALPQPQSQIFPSSKAQGEPPGAPLVHTYGYVIQVPATSIPQMEQALNPTSNRLRAVHIIEVTLNVRPARILRTNAFVYYDARNTVSYPRSLISREEAVKRARLVETKAEEQSLLWEAEAEKQKWFQGLAALRMAGVPQLYVERVLAVVDGKEQGVEPILVGPVPVKKKFDWSAEEDEEEGEEPAPLTRNQGGSHGAEPPQRRRAVRFGDVVDGDGDVDMVRDQRGGRLQDIGPRSERRITAGMKRARNPFVDVEAEAEERRLAKKQKRAPRRGSDLQARGFKSR